ncbi:MAG: homoserine dehydrogenase [Planctomycetia bacterium]|nr:homoserine dehydrogenase [Planctomycetia bacterium]
METIKVGLIGFGTIGAGVAKILIGKQDQITKATGRQIELVKICDKDLTSDRSIDLPSGVLTDNLSEILDNPDISIAIELIGGLEPARSFVLNLMKAGKNVITANKALLANHGAELFSAARSLNRTIAFEAAVCGGIPIISSIGTALQANRIESIKAICNGTSNFILSQMEEKGTDYQSAVREAQLLGYAEANPSMDVDGTDATQKLAILAQLAFGAEVDWKSISKAGINCVDAVDIRFAKELSYRIRLIASAQQSPNGLELNVSPTLVPESSPLAQVKDAFNAVQIIGDSVGQVFYQGLGAGQHPTASAVCSDVIDTVLGRTAITFKTLKLWNDQNEKVVIKDPLTIYGRSYLRFCVKDQPGVLAEIASIFGKCNISIAAMIQREEPALDHCVQMIIMTHAAPEGQLRQAVEIIAQFPFVHGTPIRLSVQD